MRQAARALGYLLEWFLIIQMFALSIIVIYAVISRKMGASLSWYDEIAAIQLAWITYYGAALAALRRRHIGFDGVLLAMPIPMRRVMVILSEVLTVGFFALLTWSGWEVVKIIEGMSLVSLTFIPVQLTQSVIPIGGTLFIICSLLSFPDYYRLTMAGISFEHPEIIEEKSA